MPTSPTAAPVLSAAEVRDRLALDPALSAACSTGDFAARVRALGALQVITLAGALGLPAGSDATIALYKTWLGGVGERAASAVEAVDGTAAVWFTLGLDYSALGAVDNKLACFKTALAIKPTLHEAAVNIGLIHEAEGRIDLALATWRAALQPDDARAMLLNNIGRLQEGLKRYPEAARAYEASLCTTPAQPPVLHHVVGLRTKTCAWPVYDPGLPGVTREDMDRATRALSILALSDSTAHQAERNASWIAEKMPAPAAVLPPSPGARGGRLRIGYLSSDFCMHPIAYLLAELIEFHDRDRVEVFGFCSTRDDGSEVRRRLIAGFDTFADVRSLDDGAAAALIRRHGVDVLIDLNGLTLGTRLPVLRWRPAPVQGTYLGYNGPVPLPELDFIIADRFVIPPERAHLHAPRPLYMPGCFQVNDGKLPVAPPGTRAEAGLPEGAFVFCCFSNTYKVTEEVFAAWAAILRRVPGSVLWLYVDNPVAKENLLRAAGRAGVAPARLLFADRVEPSLYRGRLALADLFLDTFPYNAGTTASDALRVGLPVLTLSGETFISRMAGSLLTAVGLARFVTASLDDYVEAAVRIALLERDELKRVSAALPERWRATLGDTRAFCRALEDRLRALARQGEGSAAAA